MDCFRDKYIMSQDMFNQLSTVKGFNQKNGFTYQQHILITSWYRIPSNLHYTILNAKSGKDALKILDRNNIMYLHDNNRLNIF
jgi:hypothetical protein